MKRVRSLVDKLGRLAELPRGVNFFSEVGRSVASWSAGVRGSLVRGSWSQVEWFVPKCWQPPPMTEIADAQPTRSPLRHAITPLPLQPQIPLPSCHAVLLDGKPPRLTPAARRHFTERTHHFQPGSTFKPYRSLLDAWTRAFICVRKHSGGLRRGTTHSHLRKGPTSHLTSQEFICCSTSLRLT